MQSVSISVLLAMSLTACGAKGDDGTPSTTDTGAAEANIESNPSASGSDTATEEDSPPVGFGLRGVVANPFTSPPEPAPAGLCVMAADPTPAMIGDDLESLATGRTGEGGTYELSGIETPSTLGIVVIVEDCEETVEADRSMYPTGTGMAFEVYGTLEPGAVATLNLNQLRLNLLADIDSALTEVGHLNAPPEMGGEPSTFTDQGGLIAFMRDSVGAPVPDATINCAGGYCPTYYNTEAAVGGLSFLGADGLATQTGADGLAFIPGAPITNYSGTHADMEFESRTMGALPGVALVVNLAQIPSP